LRKKILANMMQQGMARRQAEEALDVDVRDVRLDIRRSLAQEPPAASFSDQREAPIEARTQGDPTNPESELRREVFQKRAL
jgi:hypothetical protein